MADYVYRKIVRRHWYGRFKFRRRVFVISLCLILLIALVLGFDLHRSNKKTSPTSNVQNVVVSDVVNTFTSDLFKFQDTGKWVLNKQESTSSKFIYYKFHGNDVESQLIVYVNQIPIPLDLEVPRVLPVRIVNNNSFDVTSVSGPCIGSYSAGELHKVRIININGAEMLCDPDSPQYKVVLAEINGNYKLPLQTSDGKPLSLVITYRDLRQEPGDDSLLRIANSFQSL